MKKFLPLIALLFLCGCPVDDDGTVHTKTVTQHDDGEDYTFKADIDGIEIERLGIVRDSTAYDYRRSVYRITDKTTGQTFIGISGIGISELGSHSAGKTVRHDER